MRGCDFHFNSDQCDAMSLGDALWRGADLYFRALGAVFGCIVGVHDA